VIYRFQRTLSYRLLAWGILSLAGAVWFGLRDPSTPFEQAMALQFVVWGAVDALIALFSLRGLEEKLRRMPDVAHIERESQKLTRILWINSGLDVLYLSAGLFFLLVPGRADEFARGSGAGILIQGGFLLVFDLLHALSIPREVKLPSFPHFTEPSHLPFDLPGERGVVILVHGFPGTPVEMRSLGEEINRHGWRALGLLLPGFGYQIEHLFQQRVNGWVDAVASAVEQARAETHGPVILVGFSLGGGLALCAAPRARPDALVLISPFWLDLHPRLTFLLRFAGIFFPEYLRPARLMRPEQHLNSQALHLPPGNLYPPAGDILSRLDKDFRIPIVFLDQFIELSHLVRRSAPQTTVPTLMVQGDADPLVRLETTLRLAELMPTRPEIVEVPGSHHITISEAEGYCEMKNAVYAFISRYNNPAETD
jgi:carboxylesterase